MMGPGEYLCIEDIMNPRPGAVISIYLTPLWFWAV